MRTLIISDLHLGGRLGHDVLRRLGPLHRLLEELDGVDRLILLGDIVELMEGRNDQAMAIAEPAMRAIGSRLGPSGQVVIVPGNHDAPLVRRWVRAAPQLERLTVDSVIPANATPLLARLVAMLSPAQVEVRYPGVWVAPRLWATHGHYVNRHLVPSSAIGVARGRFGDPPFGSVTPAEYERGRSPGLRRATRWLPRPVVAVLGDAFEVARALTMPRVRRHLLRPQLSPLTARLLGIQMQRASIPALLTVVRRLGIEADWVVFGHVHRLGPLQGDVREQWQDTRHGPAPGVLNCGSWLYEPLLVHGARPPHPYWPGGAVEVVDDGPPRAIGLLDDLGPSDLR